MGSVSKNPLHGFRVVPQAIRHQITNLGESQSFQVGYRAILTKSQVEAGELAHVGVNLQNGSISYEPSFLPKPVKRWARWNVHGKLKVRRDLPKRDVCWLVETPNFGDGERFGYTTHLRSVPAFRREVVHARGLRILVSHEEISKDRFAFALVVDVVFDSGTAEHDPNLLMAVSLIGETVGYPQVLDSRLSASEWGATQLIEWEILPVDHNGPLPAFEVVSRRAMQRTGRELPDTYRERYEGMKALAPRKIYEGTSGFDRYLVYAFDNAVVLENFTYGNAAYVMFDDWKELSQRTRPDLLSDPTANYVRVIHKSGWEKRIAAEVNAKVD